MFQIKREKKQFPEKKKFLNELNGLVCLIDLFLGTKNRLCL